jgi:hypothetical protein
VRVKCHDVISKWQKAFSSYDVLLNDLSENIVVGSLGKLIYQSISYVFPLVNNTPDAF